MFILYCIFETFIYLNPFYILQSILSSNTAVFLYTPRAEISVSPLATLCTAFQRELVRFQWISTVLGKGLMAYLTNDYAISQLSDNFCFFFAWCARKLIK